MKRSHKLISPLLACLFAAAGGLRADTVLVDDDFESGTLGSWPPLAEAGRDSTPMMGWQTTDYSTSTTNAAELYKSGTNGTLTLTEPLPLDTQGYTSVTIALNWKFQNGSSTRRVQLQYAPDGSTFETVREFNTPFGGNPIDGMTSVTLNEGTGDGEFEFTDAAKFRFSFGSNRADHRVYLDDIVISGTPDFVGASAPFAITEIERGPAADEVTLTWASRPNTTYRAFYSLDLSNWENELADNLGGLPGDDQILDDGDLFTHTFDLGEPMIEDEAVVFFRIEEE